MKNILLNQLEKVIPKGMTIPPELKKLYEWIEYNKFYVDGDYGRCGFLDGKDETLGTSIQFICDEKDVSYWFDENNDSELKSRFCCFAVSGDGSMCGLWKSNNDEIKIVHIGSGSGSTLVCTLADNMVDFFRLLAIGYDEICWEDKLKYPPDHNNPDFNENRLFQNWVIETFNTKIPKTALEIIMHPATMDDENSEDEFFNWCKNRFQFFE